MAYTSDRRKRAQAPDVKNIYPSEFAKRHRSRREPLHNEGRGPDAEPHAINCAQCNARIPDWTKLAECWHCESDNFHGDALPPR